MRIFRVLKAFGNKSIGEMVTENYITNYFLKHVGFTWNGTSDQFNKESLGEIEHMLESRIKRPSYSNVDIIIMKTGKSLLLDNLGCGKKLFINITRDEPFNCLKDEWTIDVTHQDISLETIISDDFNFSENCDTVIFYTDKKYSESQELMDACVRSYVDTHLIFMFKEV